MGVSRRDARHRRVLAGLEEDGPGLEARTGAPITVPPDRPEETEEEEVVRRGVGVGVALVEAPEDTPRVQPGPPVAPGRRRPPRVPLRRRRPPLRTGDRGVSQERTSRVVEPWTTSTTNETETQFYTGPPEAPRVERGIRDGKVGTR